MEISVVILSAFAHFSEFILDYCLMALREKKKKKRQIAKHFAENDRKPARSTLKKEDIAELVLCMVTFWIFIVDNTTF